MGQVALESDAAQMRMAAGMARNIALPLDFQLRAHFGGRAGAKELAAVHDCHARCKGERFFQTVFGQRMVVPNSRLILPRVARKSDAAMGSSWLVGSSRISTFGCKTITEARFKSCFLPAGQLCDQVYKTIPESRKTMPFPQRGGESSAYRSRGIPSRTPARARPYRSRSDFPDFAAQSRFFQPVRAGIAHRAFFRRTGFLPLLAMRRENGF